MDDKVVLDWNCVVKSLGYRSRVDPGVTFVALFNKRRPWVFDALINWFQDSPSVTTFGVATEGLDHVGFRQPDPRHSDRDGSERRSR